MLIINVYKGDGTFQSCSYSSVGTIQLLDVSLCDRVLGSERRLLLHNCALHFALLKTI